MSSDDEPPLRPSSGTHIHRSTCQNEEHVPSDNQSVFSEVVESVADNDFPVEVEEEISIVEDIVPSRALRDALVSLNQSGGDEVTAHVLAWSSQVCVAIRVARSKGRYGCGERTAELQSMKVVLVGATNVVVQEDQGWNGPKRPASRKVCTVQAWRLDGPLVAESGRV